MTCYSRYTTDSIQHVKRKRLSGVPTVQWLILTGSSVKEPAPKGRNKKYNGWQKQMLPGTLQHPSIFNRTTLTCAVVVLHSSLYFTRLLPHLGLRLYSTVCRPPPQKKADLKKKMECIASVYRRHGSNNNVVKTKMATQRHNGWPVPRLRSLRNLPP